MNCKGTKKTRPSRIADFRSSSAYALCVINSKAPLQRDRPAVYGQRDFFMPDKVVDLRL